MHKSCPRLARVAPSGWLRKRMLSAKRNKTSVGNKHRLSFLSCYYLAFTTASKTGVDLLGLPRLRVYYDFLWVNMILCIRLAQQRLHLSVRRSTYECLGGGAGWKCFFLYRRFFFYILFHIFFVYNFFVFLFHLCFILSFIISSSIFFHAFLLILCFLFFRRSLFFSLD